PPREGPRLPPADADPCGPGDTPGPASQGPRQALGLTDALPAGAQLRRSADFTATLRASRAARADGMLVLHAALPTDASAADAPPPARVGFVVPRAVGPAVTRNLVRRRLRHLLRDRLARLPA